MEFLPGADPGFIKIIHPETGNQAEVYNDGAALAQYWQTGWVPLTAEDAKPAEAEPGTPAPMTEAQVAEGLAAEKPAASSKSAKSTTKE